MHELGYEGEYKLTPAQESKYLRRACEYNFVHQRNQVQVEIHWQVAPVQLGLAVEFDRLWSRTQLFPICGAQLRVFSPEDAILVHSIHGFKHLWCYLKWVCDIAALLSSAGELDWSYVLDEADRIGAGRVVLVALLLANEMFQSRVPDSIPLRLIRDPVAVAISKGNYWQLFNGRFHAAFESAPVDSTGSIPAFAVVPLTSRGHCLIPRRKWSFAHPKDPWASCAHNESSISPGKRFRI